MPVVPLDIAPGIYSRRSRKGAKGRWIDGVNVWWPDGQNIATKMRGSVKLIDDTFDGVCRGMMKWYDLSQNLNIALGTHLRLFVAQGGTISNITPIRDDSATSGALSNPFSSTSGSSIISVAHTTHGITTVGTYVEFTNATASPVDGTLIDGWYQVVEVTDANTFTIDSGVTAATTEANFGDASVDWQYEINAGFADTTIGKGFGTGPWGEEEWGDARANASGVSTDALVWKHQKGGEDLFSCPRGGDVYKWDTSVGVSTRAASVGGSCPNQNNTILVDPTDRRLNLYGTKDQTSGTFDPLLLRWGIADDFTTIDSTINNDAGGKRLESGSEIVNAVIVTNGILILTDESAHLQYRINTDDVYGFRDRGRNCGLIAQNAITSVGGIGYWMGQSDFFIYDGMTRILECDIWEDVFNDMNLLQKAKFHVGYNEDENELRFYYCSAGSTEIDKFASYNVLYGYWSKGDVGATSWASAINKSDNPVSARPDYYIHEQNIGVDNDSSVMGSSLTTYDIAFDELGTILYLARLIPDFKTLVGTAHITVNTKKYPQDASYNSVGPKDVMATTKYITPRVRARLMNLFIEIDGLGEDYAMDTMEADLRRNGRI